MRINSGLLGRRTFNVPKDGLRPTMEQAREGVFSSLAARVPGARVLDLFAGSGSLGLEAWSRGAASVTAVEKVSKHWKILQENFQSLEPTASGHSASRRKGDASFQCLENQEDAGSACLGSWQAVQADVYEFLKRSAGPFDLIFADPPYDEADLPKLLEALRGVLAPDGLLVFEMRSREAYSAPPEWNLIKEKRYGGTRMLFLELLK
jgi:16S rRNA (guanine966-N2)-methyltransferase